MSILLIFFFFVFHSKMYNARNFVRCEARVSRESLAAATSTEFIPLALSYKENCFNKQSPLMETMMQAGETTWIVESGRV